MDSGRDVLGPLASCVAVVLEKCPPPRALKTTSGKANRRPRAGPLESEHHCGAGKEIFSLQIVKKKMTVWLRCNTFKKSWTLVF